MSRDFETRKGQIEIRNNAEYQCVHMLIEFFEMLVYLEETPL